jgi:hypothetical protein
MTSTAATAATARSLQCIIVATPARMARVRFAWQIFCATSDTDSRRWGFAPDQ